MIHLNNNNSLIHNYIELIPSLYSTEHISTDSKIIYLHFYSPFIDWDWYIAEGDRDSEHGYLFFGYVRGFEAEWGYFTMQELLTPVPQGNNKPLAYLDPVFIPTKFKDI